MNHETLGVTSTKTQQTLKLAGALLLLACAPGCGPEMSDEVGNEAGAGTEADEVLATAEQKLLVTTGQCYPPNTYVSYPHSIHGPVSETNYYARVKFATPYPSSGILGVFASSFWDHDREIFLNNGRICTYTWGTTETLCTDEATYADGNVHTVVHTLNSSGNRLYVDGVLKKTGVATASAFTWDTRVVVGYAYGRYLTPSGGSRLACVFEVEVR